ncbi:SagB/ThcOx family dehydrogenase [Streptomyces sp. NPDC002285]
MWDDYLAHRQHALSRGVEQVLGWFSSWRPLDSILRAVAATEDADRLHRTARVLLQYEILIVEDSPRHLQEQEILELWGKWGPHARAFHFASRSHADSPFRKIGEETVRLASRVDEVPPPPAFLGFPDSPRITLPEPDDSLLEHRDIIDVLNRRRSRREFGSTNLSLPKLATLLKTAVAPIPHVASFEGRPRLTSARNDDPLSQQSGRLAGESGSVLKTSPSGGARHPTEVYVYAQRVDGLQPGIYHYSGEHHSLEDLQRRISVEELVAACGDQEWVADANALLFYSSVVARTGWKYEMSRAYRVFALDLGHLSQTVFLLATALGLHNTFIGALRDEIIEQLLGCNPTQEIILGASVIGTEL